MCGIAGIIATDSSPLPAWADGALRAMVSALAHRGPDDEGLYWAPGRKAILGHRRLSIIDLSQRGHQPSVVGDTALVFNGEIYNYRELAKSLDNPRETSDTHVLHTMLSREGESALESLNGFFAFGYWDDARSTLLLARDALGKKPLYYTKTENAFLFSSELRSLLASGVIPREIDNDALAHYLAFYSVGAPLTLVRNVRQVRAGELLRVSPDGVESRRWWRLQPHDPSHEPRQRIVRKLRDLIDDSVRSRLVSDVPVGLFLSGGLDSNAVLAAAQSHRDGQLSTFTLSFEDDDGDESKLASVAAAKFRTDHRAVTMQPSKVPAQVRSFLLGLDQPTGDGLNTWLISHALRATDPSLKVVLSGVGGDELFIGYKKFRHLAQHRTLLSAITALPASVRTSVSRRAGRFSASRYSNLLRTYLNPLETRVLFDRDEQRELLSIAPSEDEIAHEIDRTRCEQEVDILIRLLRSDIEGYLTRTLLRDLDNVTMAHGLEARAPFLDRSLVAYAWNIPLSERAYGRSKQLLQEAFASEIPQEIQRKRKSGFELPMGNWLRDGPLQHYRRTLDSEENALVQDGLLAGAAVHHTVDRFVAGKSHYLKVWSLIVLEDWYRRVIRQEER